MTSGRQEVIRHVLWHYGHPKGHQPGRFTTCLMEAFSCADPGNFARLNQAFPDYGAAMFIAKNNAHGVDNLEAMLSESEHRPDLKVVRNTTPERGTT